MRELLSLDDLNDCLAASETRPVVVFKHSTRCPISSAAYREVEAFEKAGGGGAEVFLIKVVESRPVSNAAAQALNVEHQSPQLILVNDHEPVWSASHYAVTAKNIGDALGKIGPTGK